MPQASMHQRAAFFFTCLALGGLSIVPVYASNGTVLLLSLGVLGFCRLKGGLHFIRDSLLTVAGMFFIALTVWIFLSLTWTEDGLRELPAALTMTLLSILGLIFMASVKDLDSRQTKIAQTILIIACLSAMALFLFEYLTGAALGRYLKGRTTPHIDFVGRGLSILISIIWPVAVLILKHYGKPLWASAVILVAAAIAYQYPNEAMFLGLLIGAFTFISSLCLRKVSIIFVFGVFALLVITGPIIAYSIMNVPTIKKQALNILTYRKHRINIWEFVAKKVEERPVLGHGFESARRLGAIEDQYYKETRNALGASRFRIKLPLHPHNIPLQIWLELGLVGIILYLGILFGICRILWRWRGPPVWAAAFAASTASYLTVSSLSFGAWQNWWLATAWLTVGICILASKQAAPQINVSPA
jgi:O-antigen ligase